MEADGSDKEIAEEEDSDSESEPETWDADYGHAEEITIPPAKNACVYNRVMIAALGFEVNLYKVQREIILGECSYNPRKLAGLQIHLTDVDCNKFKILLYQNGTVMLVGDTDDENIFSSSYDHLEKEVIRINGLDLNSDDETTMESDRHERTILPKQLPKIWSTTMLKTLGYFIDLKRVRRESSMNRYMKLYLACLNVSLNETLGMTKNMSAILFANGTVVITSSTDCMEFFNNGFDILEQEIKRIQGI
jgi:TATA-box binding protein (TBP) (component of TFIID and TFIIIB)